MTKIDEATVRACIDALDNNEQYYARDTLLALLPKPVDQAAELVTEWAALETTEKRFDDFFGNVSNFARWMLARQPDPVDPVEPLTHDEIVKEAREWCAKVFAECAGSFIRGARDNQASVRTAIAILTAWKGEK